MAAATGAGTPREVLAVALKLGLTSFGGPIAHLGYFRREYVERRRWLDERSFADLVALCQLLPGPASSQLGIAIGTRRAGLIGGIAAWLGFTAPSAIAMIGFAVLASSSDIASAGWVHGLKLAAVAIVAQAVLLMAGTLAPDWPRRLVTIAATVVALLWSTPLTQVAVIIGGGVIGYVLLRAPLPTDDVAEPATVSRRTGAVLLITFAALLVGLPLVAAATGSLPVAQLEGFYRSGALVFGGGHVVLPLLQSATVDPGWIGQGQFLAGYGAAQAVPGPLFTFAAYLGTVSIVAPAGWLGGLLCLGAIFLPSFLLIWGVMPFWARLRASESFRRALAGTGAAVVGLLAAALYNPVWTGSVNSIIDVAVAAAALGLLFARLPPIVVVALCALAGQALTMWRI
ncbi:MAG: chromate efflux transporter [Chloroflexota bacterium]